MDLMLYCAELVGTVAFALSGAMLAAHKGLDLFGVVFLGIVTAVGGGTVRDVLLGLTPPRMFYNYEYVALAVATSLALFLVFRLSPRARSGLAGGMDLLYNLCDAVGLGLFVVVGTQACLDAGYADNLLLRAADVTITLGQVCKDHEKRPHSHPEEQVALVIEGECDYYVDGVPYHLTPGGFVVVPPNVEHYIDVHDTDIPCFQMDIFGTPRPGFKKAYTEFLESLKK